MANANKANAIEALLEKSKALKAQQEALRKQTQEAKKAIAMEFESNVSEETKKELLSRATAMLTEYQSKRIALVKEFRAKATELKAMKAQAKELLSLANYSINASLPRTARKSGIENGNAIFEEEATQTKIAIPANAEWQKEMKKQLLAKGYSDNQARNIIYKISKEEEANNVTA